MAEHLWIKVRWLGKSVDQRELIRPLLQRSYESWLGNEQKDVTSEYMGGEIIILTTFVNGECWQVVLLKSERHSLGADCRQLLSEALAPSGHGIMIAVVDDVVYPLPWTEQRKE